MQADEFYDGTEVRTRTLREGDGVRNTHNFLKACLIDEHVPRRSHLLDLGCGQGGDLRKFARRTLKSYRGIDISHVSIEHNRERMSNIREFRCRSKLECIDFCETAWARAAVYDVVSCQFALQYAFATRETAHFVIKQIADSLKKGGVFIGCIPVHKTSGAFEKVLISLPGDQNRTCIEYNAPHDEVARICAMYGLVEVLWSDFDTYYEEKRAKYAKLAKRMRAFAPPAPDNGVFVFCKVADGSVLEKTARTGDAGSDDTEA